MPELSPTLIQLPVERIDPVIHLARRRRGGFGFRGGPSPLYSLHYMVQGQGVFDGFDDRTDLTPGTLLCVPPGVSHDFWSVSEQEPVTLIVFLDLATGMPAFSRGKRPPFHVELKSCDPLPHVMPVEPGSQPETWLKEITRERRDDGGLARLEQKLLLAQLLAAMLRWAESGSPRTDNQRTYLQRAVGIIEARQGEQLSVEQLAQSCGCSESYLHQAFRKHLSMTPMAYALKCKMEHARLLLTDTDLPMSRIAEQLGYSSQFAFTRAFSCFEGKPPTAYRAQMAAASDAPPHVISE